MLSYQRLHGSRFIREMILHSCRPVSQGNTSKPLNILVRIQHQYRYATWKNLLTAVLSKDMYTIYSLNDNQLLQHVWQDTCALIVYEFGNSDLTKQAMEVLCKFILNKGKVIFYQFEDTTTVLNKAEENLSFPEEAFRVMADFGIGEDIKPGLANDCFCILNSDRVIDVPGGSFAEITAGKFKFCLERLGFSVESCTDVIPQLTHGVLFSTKGLKPWEIFRCGKVNEDVLSVQSNDCAIHFHKCGTILDSHVIGSEVLPVFYADDESSLKQLCKFDFSVFKRFLTTKYLGRSVICVDVIGSTQDLLKELQVGSVIEEGLTVVARQQIKGKGRAGNVWLSPAGCMMFSCQLSLRLDSLLGKCLPYVQHVCATAAVAAVKDVPGYENLDLNLKWPNDIYIHRQVKVGGLVVNSSCHNGRFVVTFGLGLNIANAHPTSCVNSLIAEHNKLYKTALPERSVEEVLARTLNKLEEMINLFEVKGTSWFCEEYYKYWMHGGSKVVIEAKGNAEATIIGLDEHGYLLVELCQTKEKLSLQPDGNSFDMMRNMIVMKGKYVF